MTTNATIEIGFRRTPENPGAFPGFEGGIRIAVDDTPLTGFENQDELPINTETFHDAEGNPLPYDTNEFVGDTVNTPLRKLKRAVVRFIQSDFDRYEEIPAEFKTSRGNTVVVFSYLDGHDARIAFQPVKGPSDVAIFRTASLVGYAIDPRDVCSELIDCFDDTLAFMEAGFGGRGFEEDVESYRETVDEHVSSLERFVDDA